MYANLLKYLFNEIYKLGTKGQLQRYVLTHNQWKENCW